MRVINWCIYYYRCQSLNSSSFQFFFFWDLCIDFGFKKRTKEKGSERERERELASYNAKFDRLNFVEIYPLMLQLAIKQLHSSGVQSQTSCWWLPGAAV